MGRPLEFQSKAYIKTPCQVTMRVQVNPMIETMPKFLCNHCQREPEKDMQHPGEFTLSLCFLPKYARSLSARVAAVIWPCSYAACGGAASWSEGKRRMGKPAWSMKSSAENFVTRNQRAKELQCWRKVTARITDEKTAKYPGDRSTGMSEKDDWSIGSTL